MSPYCRCIDFLIGMGLGELARRGTLVFNKWYASIIEITSILSFVILFLFLHNCHNEGYYYLVPTLFLIMAFISNNGAISNLLENSIFVRLSKYSFSFYLFHYVVTSYTNILLRYLDINNPVLLYIAVLIDFIIVSKGAVLLHKYIEQRLVNRITKQISK